MIFPYWAKMYNDKLNLKASEHLKKRIKNPASVFTAKLLHSTIREILGYYLKKTPAFYIRLLKSSLPRELAAKMSCIKVKSNKQGFYYHITCPSKGMEALVILLHEVGHLLQNEGQGMIKPENLPNAPSSYIEAYEQEATAWSYTISALAFPKHFETLAQKGLLFRPFIQLLPPFHYASAQFPQPNFNKNYFLKRTKQKPLLTYRLC